MANPTTTRGARGPSAVPEIDTDEGSAPGNAFPDGKSEGARLTVSAPARDGIGTERVPTRRGLASVRDLGRRFRQARRHSAATAAGVTIAGDSILAEGLQGSLAPAGALGTGVVQAEGAAPVSPVGEPFETVTAWLFRPGREPEPADPRDLAALVAAEENFVWVDLSSYCERDLRDVGRLLGLHRRALHAALSPWQRPRLSVYDAHFFTSATVALPDAASYRVRAAELDLFVGHNFLVSAHKRPLPFADHLLARARTSPELVALDSTFMLYIVLDEVLAYYEELDRHVQAEVERMEERALHDTSDRFLEDLLRFKRYAFALAQLAEEHRPVFAAFLRPDFHWVSGEEVEEYYEDLEGRLSRLLDALGDARDAVNGAFDIYVSHMSHRTNAVIKLLTIVSTILFSASIIASIFGTSIAATVHNNALTSPAGFIVMLLCMVAVSGATLYAFRRQGWI